MRTFENTIEHGIDRYVMMGAEEISTLTEKHSNRLSRTINSSWYGDQFPAFRQKVVTGDEGLVQQSEAFLEKLENQLPMTRGWRNVDDVVGAVPNVPAMLAGVPQSMRRRERTMKISAPLAIYMDLTSSGGISAEKVMHRGVALLALVRMMVEHRSVELWVGASLGQYRVSGTCAWRIDTAPLDLARSAYHVSATAMSRGFGYTMCHDLMHTQGGWPFGNYPLHCRTAPERLRPAFEGQELMYIPPIYLGDELTSNPVAWIKRVMAQYVKTEEE